MLLTITTTHEPATELGFLLHKHPGRVQRFEQSYGTAHVFYSEAAADRCTAALLLEIDPQALLRTRKPGFGAPDFSLAHYVNDRPYATSSLFAVALGDVFRSALRARSAARPELAELPLPLVLAMPAVPCRGGPDQARRLFEPLGWQVDAQPVELDPGLPGWGDSRYIGLTLTGELRLADALSHLYVLLPVLDGAKHYWVGPDEVDKLLRAGERWLPAHPDRAWITRRYLSRRNRLVRTAVSRLSELDDHDTDDTDDGSATGSDTAPATDPGEEERPPAPNPDAAGAPEPAEREPSLADRRAGAVLSVLNAEGSRSVIDFGCGSGKLLTRLLAEPGIDAVTGVDVAAGTVDHARRRLRVDRLPERDQRRLELFAGSVLYGDPRFRDYDAAVLMEVVEHIDPHRLPTAAQVVFGDTAPRTVVVTTPNAEYNPRYEWLPEHSFRHTDHRFEWTRAEFRAWADDIAHTYGYRVRFLPVGPEDPDAGASTQMGVFTR